MAQTSPRLARRTAQASGAAGADEAELTTRLITLGLTTTAAVSTGCDAEALAAGLLGAAATAAKRLWQLADEDFDAELAAKARAKATARKHGLLPQQASAAQPALPAQAKCRSVPTLPRKARQAPQPLTSAEVQAEEQLRVAVSVAMAMASLAPAGASARMKALQQAKVTGEERDELLRDMITRRCTSPGTILQRIRYLERVRRLAEAKGWDFWKMTEVQLCL